MNTYISQSIYRIKCQGTGTEQYDEQWRIIFANDEREALHKAREVAMDEAVTFIDRHGRTVSWELIAVKWLQPVDLQHGALLFSAVKEVEPIASPVWIDEHVTA